MLTTGPEEMKYQLEPHANYSVTACGIPTAKQSVTVEHQGCLSILKPISVNIQHLFLKPGSQMTSDAFSFHCRDLGCSPSSPFFFMHTLNLAWVFI